jgi:hypothetical protein
MRAAALDKGEAAKITMVAEAEAQAERTVKLAQADAESKHLAGIGM